ncbi:insulinase family protein [Candidatus Albibeggiatoa sp. nov. NOAA]|uniref:insulinase family protein n=1 Tax=Candidatus Albibeggiatoa sp. nov. NOAA TaxID=3162724 RepID=UPI0032F884BB|nr:insulinase family protein [Thiotrichaceae bacterium]
MTHPAFKPVRTVNMPSLNVEYQEYEHKKTGARHIHLASEDTNNAFLVAFLTVPQDSTGVAHILEHTALCGSQRYPVRDPFFMMIRRSLNTFMNAFTSSDWTAYPFATQNRKDFSNLLQVYLDATFFPNLNELDFAQEGHRLEFAEKDNPESELMYKGVVFNEMKGAMSSPLRQLHHTIQSHLFPTTTYHHNSGGEPLDIPSLTHEQLKQFHATHYHPSNAVLMTYGNFDVNQHHKMFEELALSQFDKIDTGHLRIPAEQRLTAQKNIDAHYTFDEENTANKTHIVLSWLLNDSSDIREAINGHLLSGILLDNSSSPLRHALETTSLGLSPSSLSGFDANTFESTFACGLEGSEVEHADEVEKLIMGVLQDIADNGVPQSLVDSMLHQIELHQREITGDGFPYGLQLILQGLSMALYHGDPVAALDIDTVLEQLRQDCQNPDFIPSLVKRYFIDNPHRVRVTMSPDRELSKQQIEQEKAQLATIEQQLTDEQKTDIIQRAQTLDERQKQQDDPELLPKVTLDDVPTEMPILEGSSQTAGHLPMTWFTSGTNGMVYQRIVIDLPQLESELLDILPLFCDCMTELGYGDKDYRQAAEWQALVTGGLNASLSMRGHIGDTQKIRGVFSLSGKALARNQQHLIQLLHDTLTQVRFDELEHIRELINQIRSDMDNSITDRGHVLAMTAATSTLSPCTHLTHRWQGLAGIQFIRQLDDALKQDDALQAFADKLKRIQTILLNAPSQLLAIGDDEHQANMQQHLTTVWQDFAKPQQIEPLTPTASLQQIKQAWAVNTQVNFCAKAYPTVPPAHADAPVLIVLGLFLRNGFLHRTIREQGGAYGGGANYHGDSGAFRFFSYRDPRLAETLQDFDNALTWLQETEHEPRTLEEAILGIIGQIDRPASPAGEASISFFNSLHGRTPEQRRKFRQQILQVTIEDLVRVAKTYLQPEKANIVVVSNTKNIEAAPDLGLEILSL